MLNQTSTEVLNYLQQTSKETLSIHHKFMEEYSAQLIEAAAAIGQAINNKGKLLILGNGGSAADAQHMAAEMVGRMLIERRPLPAIALTTDSSNLTAIGNDYGYDLVFERQVQALAQPQDVILAISTSGKSLNVLKAVQAAKKVGCKVIGLTGRDGGELKSTCDIWLNVSAGKNSSRIQETHIFAVHSMVDLCDRFFLGNS